MENFQDQLERNLLTAVATFNSDSSLDEVRQIYTANFDAIKNRINQIGVRPAIEDVESYNPSLSQKIMAHFLLLKDVNEAIKLGLISKKDIR